MRIRNVDLFLDPVLRSRSREAEIKWPPGAGAEITNYGSGSLAYYQILGEIL